MVRRGDTDMPRRLTHTSIELGAAVEQSPTVLVTVIHKQGNGVTAEKLLDVNHPIGVLGPDTCQMVNAGHKRATETSRQHTSTFSKRTTVMALYHLVNQEERIQDSTACARTNTASWKTGETGC